MHAECYRATFCKKKAIGQNQQYGEFKFRECESVNCEYAQKLNIYILRYTNKNSR